MLQVIVSLSSMNKIVSFDKVDHLLLQRHMCHDFPSLCVCLDIGLAYFVFRNSAYGLEVVFL